jgi:type VI secretion system protein ImpL
MIYLKHIEGSKRGQVESFDLERIRIGRHPDNDVKFNPDADRAVSGHHAEILCQGEHVTVRDLQSRNGTLVNGRRINQPTELREGDIIQFAATGPKIVFSLGEAAAGTGTIVVDRDAMAPVAAPATGAAVAAQPAPRWKRSLLPAVLVLLALIAMGLAAWWSWTALFAVSGVLAAVALVVAGVWWWTRRRAARTEAAPGAPLAAPGGTPMPDPVSVAVGGDPNTIAELRGKWTQALARLRGSKLGRQGDDALSALPWLVALGERGAGKSELIRGGNPPASVSTVRQAVSGTRTCDWWFFDGAVVLDTPGRYTFPMDARVDAREWQEFVSLLARSRPEEPLNGVLIAVPADALAVRSDASLRDEATQIRRRLDDLVRRTEVTPPIYLVVTKLDLLAGFAEFFAEVPEPHRGQAMGWVNDDLERGESPTTVLQRALSAVGTQLDRLRLSVLDGRDGAGPGVGRRFLFPEEFRALAKPVRVFAEALVRPNQYDETPWFRGIFFTAARADGVPASCLVRTLGFADAPLAAPLPPGPAFVRDLFAAILPQDRELVRRTGRTGRRAARIRRNALLTAAAVVLVIGALLTVSYLRNSRALARLDLTSCLSPTGSAAPATVARLERLEQCRLVVGNLVPHGFWDRATSDFGLRQAERIEGPLVQRYLDAFRHEIEEPLDVAVDRALAPGPEAPAVVSAVLQRIGVIGKCRADGRCPSAEATEAWPNYRALLGAAEPRIQDGDPAIGLLRRTQAAYLGWLTDPRALDEMRARDVARVARDCGFEPRDTAAFYLSAHPLLKVDGSERVLTMAGRKLYTQKRHLVS